MGIDIIHIMPAAIFETDVDFSSRKIPFFSILRQGFAAPCALDPLLPDFFEKFVDLLIIQFELSTKAPEFRMD